MNVGIGHVSRLVQIVAGPSGVSLITHDDKKGR